MLRSDNHTTEKAAKLLTVLTGKPRFSAEHLQGWGATWRGSAPEVEHAAHGRTNWARGDRATSECKFLHCA
jgi:hypothetical protein